jgi:hypothetical protein
VPLCIQMDGRRRRFIPEIDLAKNFPKSEVQVDLLAHFSVADSRHCELLLRPAVRLIFTARKW